MSQAFVKMSDLRVKKKAGGIDLTVVCNFLVFAISSLKNKILA